MFIPVKPLRMNLVTGATGLLGSYLARLLLDKGEKVRAIRRSTSRTDILGSYADRIEWVEGDVLDVCALEEAMRGVTRVYHCAAVISFLPSQEAYMMKVNIDGTANVMNAAMAAGVHKVVHVSSEAAFGMAPEGKVIDEKYTDPNISKRFPYFISKHYGEREAWRAEAEGLNVAIGCPGTIIGAGVWKDINGLFPDVDKGLKFYTTATIGFVDVRDVAECLYRMMHSDVRGEKFLIIAENASFRDVTWMIADALGRPRPQWAAGRLLLALAWRWEWLRSLFTDRKPLLSKDSARLARISFQFSNEKVCRTFGFRFRPLSETIRDTALAYRQSMAEGKDFGIF